LETNGYGWGIVKEDTLPGDMEFWREVKRMVVGRGKSSSRVLTTHPDVYATPYFETKKNPSLIIAPKYSSTIARTNIKI